MQAACHEVERTGQERRIRAPAEDGRASKNYIGCANFARHASKSGSLAPLGAGLAWHANCLLLSDQLSFTLEAAMPIHDPKRRLLLNRMITLGTALTVFPVLSACKEQESAARTARDQSRQNQTPNEPSGESESSTATGDQSGGEGAKMTKAQAQYQEQPKGDQQCSNCVHFMAESGTCKLVQGPIAPDAWCMLWSEGS